MTLTGKDKDIYEHLLRDLRAADGKISKKQILNQFDYLYSKWFSPQVNTQEVRKDFEKQIDIEVRKWES